MRSLSCHRVILKSATNCTLVTAVRRCSTARRFSGSGRIIHCAKLCQADVDELAWIVRTVTVGKRSTVANIDAARLTVQLCGLRSLRPRRLRHSAISRSRAYSRSWRAHRLLLPRYSSLELQTLLSLDSFPFDPKVKYRRNYDALAYARGKAVKRVAPRARIANMDKLVFVSPRRRSQDFTFCERINQQRVFDRVPCKTLRACKRNIHIYLRYVGVTKSYRRTDEIENTL